MLDVLQNDGYSEVVDEHEKSEQAKKDGLVEFMSYRGRRVFHYNTKSHALYDADEGTEYSTHTGKLKQKSQKNKCPMGDNCNKPICFLYHPTMRVYNQNEYVIINKARDERYAARMR